MRGIHDLTVFDDRLYLAYGDANENLGRVIPIGLRSFSSDDDPNADNEFDTDEEQVERYRLTSDGMWVAGVDATEDSWLGNVYFRSQPDQWVRSRTLDGGVHVHDVFDFGGAHWAVGSGSQEAEWNVGDIYAHLWRSLDGGTSFEVVERVHNGGDGDARWVRLLPVGDTLYMFGYTSNAQFQVDNTIGATHDGQSLTMLDDAHPLRWLFALETDRIEPQLGIVRGVDVSADLLTHGVWTLSPQGALPVAGLVGSTVVDLFVHAPTGESVLLTYDGDDYTAGFDLTSWHVRILVTADFATFDELVSFDTDVAPRSIAYWRGRLYYGTDHGQVWRAAPLSAAP